MLALAADTAPQHADSRQRDDGGDEVRRTARAARLGDRAAFARLYEQFAPMVHGIALSRASMSDAADIVQEVFLHALRHVHTLRHEAAVGPWLASIARHLAAEHYRRRPAAPLMLAQHAAAGRASAASVDEATAVLAVIRSLPDAYCETLVLRLVEGLTGPQIAACTGMTPGSVRVNLHRGMQLLRQKLGLEPDHE
jgi:RNA polymerase sigma-70 factor (ECF subfamily)